MIRPLHDWIVVKEDPPRELSDTIIVQRKDRVRTGTVLRVGPGKWCTHTAVRIRPGVEPGEKIAYFVENQQTKSGDQVLRAVQSDGPGTVMIRTSDVLLAFAGCEVGEGCALWSLPVRAQSS